MVHALCEFEPHDRGSIHLVKRPPRHRRPGALLHPTKNRRSNRVALDDQSVSLPRDHRNRHVEADDESFVFCTDDNGREPWHPYWATKQFIRYRRAADIGAFRLHDLRHFMATTMVVRGFPS